MNPYIPILGIMVLATGFLAVSMLLSAFLGPSRYNKAKYDAFECGIQPTPHPEGGGRFPVKYYIVAMLFIVFDIEVVFLYPFAVARGQMDLFVVFQMVLFILLVFVAFFYVLRRRGLDWD